MKLVFTVQGPPCPWQRVATVKGRGVVPLRTRQYQKAVKLAAYNMVTFKGFIDFMVGDVRLDKWPLDARYLVSIDAIFADRRRRDIDNVAKSVLDALNGVCFLDDSQVDHLTVRRLHVAGNENPRTEITVEVLPSPASAKSPSPRSRSSTRGSR